MKVLNSIDRIVMERRFNVEVNVDFTGAITKLCCTYFQ
jgi:hypothetical protein